MGSVAAKILSAVLIQQHVEISKVLSGYVQRKFFVFRYRANVSASRVLSVGEFLAASEPSLSRGERLVFQTARFTNTLTE